MGKKGANNVSSLVMKTLRVMNVVRDDLVGGELNIVFDNCSVRIKQHSDTAGCMADSNEVFHISQR